MPHFLFERDKLEYKFMREVSADVNSRDFDQRALEQEGVHFDDLRETAVVAADSEQQAKEIISEISQKS